MDPFHQRQRRSSRKVPTSGFAVPPARTRNVKDASSGPSLAGQLVHGAIRARQIMGRVDQREMKEGLRKIPNCRRIRRDRTPQPKARNHCEKIEVFRIAFARRRDGPAEHNRQEHADLLASAVSAVASFGLKKSITPRFRGSSCAAPRETESDITLFRRPAIAELVLPERRLVLEARLRHGRARYAKRLTESTFSPSAKTVFAFCFRLHINFSTGQAEGARLDYRTKLQNTRPSTFCPSRSLRPDDMVCFTNCGSGNPSISSWIRGKQLLECIGGHRLGKQVTLQLLTALQPEKRRLGKRLNALCRDVEVQIACQRHNRSNDRGIFRRRVDRCLLHETAVNLDPRQWIACEAAQRSIASTEIIERNANSHRSELSQRESTLRPGKERCSR